MQQMFAKGYQSSKDSFLLGEKLVNVDDLKYVPFPPPPGNLPAPPADRRWYRGGTALSSLLLVVLRSFKGCVEEGISTRGGPLFSSYLLASTSPDRGESLERWKRLKIALTALTTVTNF